VPPVPAKVPKPLLCVSAHVSSGDVHDAVREDTVVMSWYPMQLSSRPSSRLEASAKATQHRLVFDDYEDSDDESDDDGEELNGVNRGEKGRVKFTCRVNREPIKLNKQWTAARISLEFNDGEETRDNRGAVGQRQPHGCDRRCRHLSTYIGGLCLLLAYPDGQETRA